MLFSVIVVPKSKVLIKCAPLIGDKGYNQDRRQQERELSEVESDESDIDELPFKMTRKEGKVTIDEKSWCGVVSLLKKSNKVLKKVTDKSGIHIPKVKKGSLKCSVCGKKCQNKNALLHHIERSHKGEGRVECEICHKTYVNKTVLKTHKKLHSPSVGPKTPPLYQCTICDQEPFTKSWELGSHMRRKHPDTGKFPCKWPNCTKKLGTLKSQKSHESGCKKNPNYKVKKCIFRGCDKEYQRQYDLNDHMKVEHGWKK